MSNLYKTHSFLSRILFTIILICFNASGFGQNYKGNPDNRRVVLTDSILHNQHQPQLIEFIKKEIKYPDSARTHGVAGQVSLTLHINSIRSRIDQIKITRISDDLLRGEVLRVIALLSDWEFTWNNSGFGQLHLSFVFENDEEPEKDFKEGKFLINSNYRKVSRSVTY